MNTKKDLTEGGSSFFYEANAKILNPAADTDSKKRQFGCIYSVIRLLFPSTPSSYSFIKQRYRQRSATHSTYSYRSFSQKKEKETLQCNSFRKK